MDEQTARTKECPFRGIMLSILATNEYTPSLKGVEFCVGANCMLWKPWRNPDTQEVSGGDCGLKEGV
jgi:hypothetical protein